MCDSTLEPTTSSAASSPELQLAPAQGSAGGCGCGSSAPEAAVPDFAGSTRFDLQGLTCGSCVNKVETLVAALPGVETATVSLVSGGTSVLRVAGSASSEAVAAAVSAAGYPAAVQQ